LIGIGKDFAPSICAKLKAIQNLVKGIILFGDLTSRKFRCSLTLIHLDQSDLEFELTLTTKLAENVARCRDNQNQMSKKFTSVIWALYLTNRCQN